MVFVSIELGRKTHITNYGQSINLIIAPHNCNANQDISNDQINDPKENHLKNWNIM